MGVIVVGLDPGRSALLLPTGGDKPEYWLGSMTFMLSPYYRAYAMAVYNGESLKKPKQSVG